MPKCVIDGREVEFTPGQNLVQVAKKAGIEIPVFCYHEGLTVVAQCRMCMVEVEKMPKLQTACSTAATDGMVVKTKSERTKHAQAATMEFLLINHPLDCPICDKSGECDLQDNSFKYGDAYSRYTEERRTYVDLDMGPVIQKNMNRCIHCTRCIRLGTEVAGIHEMVAVRRANNTEITTVDGRPLETDYAGNYSDVCPTGSLTLKDFRFNKRVWMLKKTPTICEGCSRGCNMEIHQDQNTIYRCLPRTNLEVNKYWLCDEGRFNFHHVHDPKRVTEPAIGGGASAFAHAEWHVALDAAKSAVSGKKPVVLLGTDLTQEEAVVAQKFAATVLNGAPAFHFGTPGIKTVAEDAPADKILKRKSKTANLNGLEKLGIRPYDGGALDAVIVVTSGRATLPAELKSAKTVVGVGVFLKPQAEKFAAVLPGLTFAEKDGTVLNYENREQKFRRAIQPIGMSRSLFEIFSAWTNPDEMKTRNVPGSVVTVALASKGAGA